MSIPLALFDAAATAPAAPLIADRKALLAPRWFPPQPPRGVLIS
jgi:hypothetical protein